MNVEACQPEVMTYSDVIPGDVDPNLMSHMPPGFMCITYTLGPLDHDVHHPR
jgi:hypothetical protein